MSNRTLAIIKPDAVGNGYTGKIIDRIISEGFKIKAARLIHLSRAQTESFYAIHRERPFYNGLVDFMTSGPCMPMVLEHEDAVNAFRELIGATNPAEATDGTIRKDFAESVQNNAVHGSDSDENAQIEADFHFSGEELF